MEKNHLCVSLPLPLSQNIMMIVMWCYVGGKNVFAQGMSKISTGNWWVDLKYNIRILQQVVQQIEISLKIIWEKNKLN